MARGVRDRTLKWTQARALKNPTASARRWARRGHGTTFSGVICSMDLPLTCTKLNSRAASSAFIASLIFERATKFPKNVSNSLGSDRDDAIEIFRDQRRERLWNRQPNALFYRLRGPAVQQVPYRSLARPVIDAGEPQLGP